MIHSEISLKIKIRGNCHEKFTEFRYEKVALHI